MNRELYKNLINNTIEYYLPEYNLQQIINNLTKQKIASYKEKENSVLINTSESKSQRIKKCIDNNSDTFYIIENMLINKAYRYAIYYKCDNFNLNDNIENYIDIESLKCEKFNLIEEFDKPIFVQTDDYIAFKFCKSINPFIIKLDQTKDVFYSTLWVYHKKMKILEHRFDMIGFKSDDTFYETTFKPQLYKICTDFNCTINEFRTSKIIKCIVQNKKDEVNEISQCMGLKADSLAKLKAGKTLVMPFIGDLEIIMEESKELFDKTNETKLIKKMLEKYINNIKENAKYKSRLLSWCKGEYNSLCVNILFSYRDKNYDLFNFQDPKKINMELMNYAIEYIWGIRGDIENIR
ncbi:hypothetical protein phiCTC2A_64 (endogenous virus) [Clostridium phage phiCTC2A]|nr:hypothetical protein [Clostridium tetani]YP_009219440.1 hypothetical protein phiCT9441A_75 [Clostridium phage phiCT9441A]YP_009277271.1 hypothetical protein phiCTC2A_64 [Clostridium phage phiCTC2A]YP_009277338.1 hypothetical protein phiCT19406A_64 [Clostridium phage phiCT19406A]AJA42687.1 hypothetical protein phiCT9441A_75 [Clostridium phage phiCT9441A]AJA42754.1 hypothetical protein phiCT19406A_64 [Clostridium phage phiCT19406A]AJA42950.1 hypothetical protein phiCTC2A_64 [Clostridium phag